MAKLSAHPGEVARWETTDDTDVPSDWIVHQYSLREDGYVLVKTKLDGYRRWSGWRVYGRYYEDLPAGQPTARRFRRVLERKHAKVEAIN